MKPLILIGGGGHCKSAIDIIEADETYEIVAITDQIEKIGQYINGYKIIADDSQLPSLIDRYKYCLVTVGQLKTPSLRLKLYQQAKEAGALLPTIISPSAVTSHHSTISEGTIIFHQAIVNSGCNIGVNCIINSGSIIEHDTQIGNHTHIAPGVILNGHCKIGSRSLIGSGSVLIQETVIGDDVIIGAGSTVIKSIEEPGIYAGNPAKKIN